MAIQNNQKVNKPLILSVSVFGALMVITTLSCALAMNTDSASAESASASVNVSAACTFESNTDTAHTTTIDPGTWKEDIGQTSFTAKCNDPGGFSIYAVGYSNDEWKNTNLIGPNNSIIATNTNKNGNTSGWSMKLANGTGDTTTIISPYNDYAIVPGGSVEDPSDQTGSYAKVATYNATTTGASGSSLIATYGAYVADRQAAGMYNGKVKYTLVHPSGAEAPETKDPVFYMQDVDAIKSELTNIGDTLTATDSRDGTEYLVGKMADNNIWMLDNLALDLTNSDVKAAMYNETDTKTNATYEQLGYLFNGGGSGDSSSSLFQYATAGVANWTRSYSYSAPLVNLANKDVVPQGSDPMAETVLAGGWKTGGFYNYCAASAGTYCYGNGTSYTGSPSDRQNGVRSIDADICPSGWRLPTGNTTGEFYALATAITGTAGEQVNDNSTKFREEFHYPLPGYSDNGSMSSQGSGGSFWSSTRSNSDFMYRLYAWYMSTVIPDGHVNRSGGLSVRCILGS